MNSITTKDRDELSMLKQLLKETREQFTNAIHWEDMHPIMKRIDEVIQGEDAPAPPRKLLDSTSFPRESEFEFLAEQLGFDLGKNDHPYPYIYKSNETETLAIGWRFAFSSIMLDLSDHHGGSAITGSQRMFLSDVIKACKKSEIKYKVS